MDTTVIVLIAIIVVAAVGGGYLYVQNRTRERRAADTRRTRLNNAMNNVLMADPITRDNIDILRETNSEYLQQAVDLRREQVAREERRREECRWTE